VGFATGRKTHIFPYQENADVMFNLRWFMNWLRKVWYSFASKFRRSPEYIEAKRLLAFQEWFLPLESDLVPDNSILREFIGGSILRDFKLWHNHKLENGANGKSR
jgi:uridine kinase